MHVLRFTPRFARTVPEPTPSSHACMHARTHPPTRIQCQTRVGRSVRCLATIGVHIDVAGRHVLILRLWPLCARDLAVRLFASRMVNIS